MKSTAPLLNRLLILTSKQLPVNESHNVKASFVDMTSKNINEITEALAEKHYETPKTHEERYSPPARPCGEGIYEIIQHGEGGSTHLVYDLEIPEEPGSTEAILIESYF
jgi:hypothetical protein